MDFFIFVLDFSIRVEAAERFCREGCRDLFFNNSELETFALLVVVPK